MATTPQAVGRVNKNLHRLHLNGQTLADEGAPGETCRSIPTRSPVKFKRHRNTMLKSQNQSHDEYLETVRTQQLADGADGEQGWDYST